MKKFYFIFLLVCSIFIQPTKAQLYSTIGQFQTLQLYYNPAYAGVSSSVRANIMNRSQWSKYPGAPSTQLATIDLPLGRNIGGGAVIYNHKTGNVNDFSINLNASYRLKLNENSFFQFGLKAGVTLINNGLKNSFYWDDNDQFISTYNNNGAIIRMGPGVYYKRKKFYSGLSLPDLFFLDPAKLYYDQVGNKTTLKRNIIFMAGTKISVSEFLAIQPNLMVKYYVGRTPLSYLNLALEFNQTFTAGVGVSYPLGYALFTRVAVSPKLKLGFRYELTSKSFQLGSYGSTELMLSYGFNN